MIKEFFSDMAAACSFYSQRRKNRKVLNKRGEKTQGRDVIIKTNNVKSQHPELQHQDVDLEKLLMLADEHFTAFLDNVIVSNSLHDKYVKNL